MPQVTLYMDEETDRQARQAALSAGLSYSRWVCDSVRRALDDQWPADFATLAGAARQFPLAEELRNGLGVDLQRIPLK